MYSSYFLLNQRQKFPTVHPNPTCSGPAAAAWRPGGSAATPPTAARPLVLPLLLLLLVLPRQLLISHGGLVCCSIASPVKVCALTSPPNLCTYGSPSSDFKVTFFYVSMFGSWTWCPVWWTTEHIWPFMWKCVDVKLFFYIFTSSDMMLVMLLCSWAAVSCFMLLCCWTAVCLVDLCGLPKYR